MERGEDTAPPAGFERALDRGTGHHGTVLVDCSSPNCSQHPGATFGDKILVLCKLNQVPGSKGNRDARLGGMVAHRVLLSAYVSLVPSAFAT